MKPSKTLTYWSFSAIDLKICEDVYEAILLNYFRGWIDKNRKNKKMRINGRTWDYYTLRRLCWNFPFMNKRTIQRKIEAMAEKGIILKCEYQGGSGGHSNRLALSNETEELFRLEKVRITYAKYQHSIDKLSPSIDRMPTPY